jgi:nitrite reductase/ring-hydroxylating ferredoxin subunit
VDHRYAEAGKWKEETLHQIAGQPLVVARADELKVNQMKLLHLEGERLVLARTEQGYVVFNDRCTHRGGSLAGGVMIRGVVQCPWHGSQFDCRSGKVTAGPATEAILTYQAAEQGGNVVLTFGVPERA